jgi:hypothetical protein
MHQFFSFLIVDSTECPGTPVFHTVRDSHLLLTMANNGMKYGTLAEEDPQLAANAQVLAQNRAVLAQNQAIATRNQQARDLRVAANSSRLVIRLVLLVVMIIIISSGGGFVWFVWID